MRFRQVWTIYRKELLESFRDRRTLMMMVGFPVLIYPLLIMGMARLQESQEEATSARQSVVDIWGNAPADLVSLLKEQQFNVRTNEGLPGDVAAKLQSGEYPAVSPPPPASLQRSKKSSDKPKPMHPLAIAAQPLILSRKVDVVLAVWPDLSKPMEQAGLGHVAVLYDSVRQDSEKAADRLTDALTKYRQTVRDAREHAKGLPQGFTTAVEIGQANVAPQSRRAGFGMGQILPFLLIMVSFTGAFYAAIDTTAGEKERGTMQTLLCAPLRSTEIVGGKFLGVWTISLISALANVISMAITFQRLTPAGFSLTVEPHVYALALLMLIPVTLMVTALFLAVGAFANEFKDGQNYLTPVLMLIMFPASAGMVPGMELNSSLMFVPILNVSLLIKSLFIGEAKPDTIFLVLVSSLVYAMLGVVFAARVFQRETVLVGGTDNIRGLFGMDRRRGAAWAPTPSLVLTVFAVALVAAFYGGLALHDVSLVTMLLSTEWIFLLLPVVLTVALLHFDPRKTLSLRLPSWRAALAGLLLGSASWVIAASIAFYLIPVPEEFGRALQKTLLLDDGKPVSLGLIWFCVAVSPAICEELLFRGLIAAGLRSLGRWPMLIVTALLFGIAHASIYRLLPTFFLGLVLGYSAWKSRSIFTSMLVHMINNGLLVALAFSPAFARFMHLEMNRPLPPIWIVSAAGVVAIALWLLSREPAEMAKDEVTAAGAWQSSVASAGD